MHKIVLYFILKPPYKDLQTPTAISSEMQDIIRKNITSYTSHQLADLSNTSPRAWELRCKENWCKEPLAIKEGTRRYPWQP